MDIYARLKVFLTEKKLVDVNFLVGPVENQKLFPAHKLIFSSASPVFERMFFGAIAERNDPIKIDDIQPEIFQVMSDFIYSDKVDIDNYNKARELWYVAKKYMLTHLEDKVNVYIISVTNSTNACTIYEFAKYVDNDMVKNKAMSVICTNTLNILNSHNFLNVAFSTLLDILDQEKLLINTEWELYQAIIKYFENQGVVIQNDTVISNTEEDEEKASSKLLLAREALMKLRYLTFTEQFALGPARCNALKDREIVDILTNIAYPASNTMPLGFSTSKTSRQ